MINNCHLFLLASEATNFFKSYPCLYVYSCNKSKYFAAVIKAVVALALGPGLDHSLPHCCLFCYPDWGRPPLLQAKPRQLPQLLLIILALQTLPQLYCPSPLHLSVFVQVRGPKLNPEFELWPQQCPAQGHCHCPSPAGHAMAGTGHVPLASCPPGYVWLIFSHCQPNSTYFLPSCFPAALVSACSRTQHLALWNLTQLA